MANAYFKVVVYVPVSHGDAIRKALAENGAGKRGNYDSCSFSVEGIGRFRPLKGARPFIGKSGKIEKVVEERIEAICSHKHLKKTLSAVRKAHPYEEPAVEVYRLENPKFQAPKDK